MPTPTQYNEVTSVTTGEKPEHSQDTTTTTSVAGASGFQEATTSTEISLNDQNFPTVTGDSSNADMTCKTTAETAIKKETTTIIGEHGVKLFAISNCKK